MQAPVSLYSPLIRHFPRELAQTHYDERYILRPVRKNGTIRWKSREVFTTEVLRREPLGFRELALRAIALAGSRR